MQHGRGGTAVWARSNCTHSFPSLVTTELTSSNCFSFSDAVVQSTYINNPHRTDIPPIVWGGGGRRRCRLISRNAMTDVRVCDDEHRLHYRFTYKYTRYNINYALVFLYNIIVLSIYTWPIRTDLYLHWNCLSQLQSLRTAQYSMYVFFVFFLVCFAFRLKIQFFFLLSHWMAAFLSKGLVWRML